MILVDLAKVQTELQMITRRYTIASEAHGTGIVEWSEKLIPFTDAMDTLRDMEVVDAISIEWIEEYCEEGARDPYPVYDMVKAWREEQR